MLLRMPPGRVLLSLITVVCAVSLSGLRPVLAQGTGRLSVAIMRRDGVMIPFASYDGDWSVSWPVDLRTMEIPITLDDVPRKWWGGDPPQKWTLWLRDGQSAPLSLAAPVLVVAGRERRLGVRTSFRATEPLPGPFEMPYPKEGVAVGGDLKIESIASVSKLSEAFKNFPSTVADDIQAAEEKALSALRGNARWQHPYSRDFRQGIPVILEAWYTVVLAQPGFGIGYIEAVKKYPPSAGEGECGLETFISGWVHTNTRTPKPKTDLTARVTYCDRNGVSYMLPLGRFELKNRTHWVFQMSSWESEWYALVEATPGRVRFLAEYFGGGRPQLF
jgi:hypothetical protein